MIAELSTMTRDEAKTKILSAFDQYGLPHDCVTERKIEETIDRMLEKDRHPILGRIKWLPYDLFTWGYITFLKLMEQILLFLKRS